MDSSLRLEPTVDGVSQLTLLGPGRGNAMGPDFWRELPTAVAKVAADAASRVLVVRGSGEHFSYGLDLPGMGGAFAEVLGQGALGRTRIMALARQMQAGFDALAALDKPVIAAIDGWCIGAGVEMIVACDLRLATTRARFALREVNVGIVADLGGLQRLPWIVGEGVAREMALTGADIDATRAERVGLVNSVQVDAAALDAAVAALAGQLARQPPLVLAGIKQVMNARIAAPVAHGLREAATLNGLLMQSEDFAEAIRAFMEKRAPTFVGR